jgi:DNA polymerase-4
MDNRIIAHIDMDAFYASVEVLDNPGLKGKPVIVGGDLNRGVVSAASYEARRFGVHSAMPIFKAKQKCPHGIFLPVRMERYKEVSRSVMAILGKFSPLVEQVSVDEAYIDLTGTEPLFGEAERVALEVKKKIREKTSLTCSIGISTCKFLAKIASDMKKPDGLTMIPPEKVQDFLSALSVRKVPGIGQKTEAQLFSMGIQYLGDVKKHPPKRFYNVFGKFGIRLVELANGIDKSLVTPYSPQKSISSEDTLPEDTDDIEILKKYLMQQAEIVARSLRKKGFKGKTLTLKIKHSDFRQITRRVTLEHHTQLSEVIYKGAVKLLDAYALSSKVRLVGVGVSNLELAKAPEQLELFKEFGSSAEKWKRVEKTLDKIVDRFGNEAVKRGALLDE